MSGGVGRQLKAAAVFMIIFAFLLTSFAGTTAGRASARASLLAFTTTAPNNWALPGANTTGTVTKFVVDQLGWNATKTYGNVGIGDGSVRALNMASNKDDINYTEKNYMAGDVTAAPWDPARIINISTPAANKTVSDEGDNDSGTASGNAGLVSFGDIGGNNALKDPFHSILFGRPVDDLMYEHPHAIQSNMYSRLVGLRVPGGSFANVGMRTIGYGY
jgi:hypothetical protein